MANERVRAAVVLDRRRHSISQRDRSTRDVQQRGGLPQRSSHSRHDDQKKSTLINLNLFLSFEPISMTSPIRW